jgi:hypothetical protein
MGKVQKWEFVRMPADARNKIVVSVKQSGQLTQSTNIITTSLVQIEFEVWISNTKVFRGSAPLSCLTTGRRGWCTERELFVVCNVDVAIDANARRGGYS